ncbi:MAG: TetR family transcriptional regulator [Marmoricola sp.]
MGRWEPDAAGRLRVAAMELFETVGYEETTVAQIADRAGVTARTFFRYFADKPEVLFAGSENLQIEMVAALQAAPDDATPLDSLRAALDRAAALLGERADFARRRHAIISAHPALGERELMKMARLSDGLADALRERGVKEPRASMTAQAGVAAFRVAFATWVERPRSSLKRLIDGNLEIVANLGK